MIKRFISLFLALCLLSISSLGIVATPKKVSAANTNLIANPSVETVNPTNSNLPQYWSKSRTGSNTGSLKYDTTGHTGNRSLYAQLKTYTSGQARWAFKHVAVTAGKTYTFNDYYKSNVTTDVVLEVKNTSNKLSYITLGSMPASVNWVQSSYEFTAPTGTKSVSVHHVLNRVGWLSTDDYSLAQKDIAPSTPTVLFSNPTNGTTITGTINISATATDVAGIAGVQFKLDGTSLGAEDVQAPYELAWDSKTASNGPHTLEAVARNTLGLSASQSIQINVNNTVTPPVDPTNVVANPSVETADPSNSQLPAGWLSNSWGTNSAQFTYSNEGHTGSRSLKTQISTYSSGDAKWYFSPVVSKGNHIYSYKDYYKSSIPSRIVAASYDSSGNATYLEVGATAPAASNWQLFSGDFIAPANSAKISVFHIIEQIGWLQIDDASLVDKGTPAPETSIVPNASLENQSPSNPNAPDKWSSGSWGSNTPTFEYVNEGHTGSRSVKVSVSNYSDGDAKWLFNPISLERGKQFRFSTWYKTNTIPHAVVMFTKDDNSVQYFGMPNPQPSGSTTTWQYYSDTFSVPLNAKNVSVFLFVANNGWLQTDDYDITSYQPTGFNRPLVTMTFDDGHEDNVSTALPMLNSYGYKTTHCYATQHVEGQPFQVQNVLKFRDSGHEICSHSVTHPFLTTLSTSSLTYELQHSRDYLRSITGTNIDNFASPYGDYNAAVNNELKKYYRSHRTVDEGYNSKDNFDIYRLRVQNVQSNTTLAEFQSWLDQAEATNTWLILVYHRIANDPGQYDSYINDFSQQLQALQNSNLTVKTYSSALDEVTAQL